MKNLFERRLEPFKSKARCIILKGKHGTTNLGLLGAKLLTPFLNYNEYPNLWTWVACPPNLDLTVHNKAVNWSVS